MFCPKCGMENPENGRFCRRCGTNLGTVSDIVTRKFSQDSTNKVHKRHKEEQASWESAMRKIFMGVAFLIVAIILGVTNAAGGNEWWFWMLIPAFAMIGGGLAHILKLRYDSQQNISVDLADDTKQIYN